MEDERCELMSTVHRKDENKGDIQLDIIQQISLVVASLSPGLAILGSIPTRPLDFNSVMMRTYMHTPI